LEYAFVDLHHRGHSLINKITEELIQVAKRQNPDVKKSQVQVFENNIRAIKVYERSGYKIVKRCESTHSETLDYLPWNVKLVMEKEL
jgi:ribosomal protein S18 acetylase RimI-like enzyme